MLRGGALKQTDDKQKWAHITCALCVDGVTFKNPNTRSQLNIPPNLFNREKKQTRKCIYCNSFTKHQTMTLAGITVKCNYKSCKNRFHVSCGYMFSSCLIDQADWPNCITILCHEHAEFRKAEIQERKVSDFKILLII